MDTFLIMVVAGCVGALVGAIAAFYVGGVRENHKRILASRREDQRRLQEWRRKEQVRIEESKGREHQREEEREQWLIDRRSEALDDIRIQALYFAHAFRSWTDRAANLEVPPKDELEQAVGFSRELAELIHQADEVSTRLALLRGHYNAHNPILEEKSRNLIESFEKQGIECYSFLSDQLKTTAASLQLSLLLLQPHRVDVIEPTSHSEVISRLAGSSLGTSVSPETFSRVEELWSVHRNKEAILEEHRREVLQAANVAKDWEIQVHLRALDAEVARTVSIRS